MIDVIFVTVGIVVNTWVHNREREKKRVSCISEQCINDVPRTLFNVEYNQKAVDVLCLIVLLVLLGVNSMFR